MSDTKGLLPCSKCGVFPRLFYDTTSQIRTKVKLSCPNCGNTVIERNCEDAAIAWNDTPNDIETLDVNCIITIEEGV